MSGKKKVFIAVGILLNLVICAAIVANYELNKVVDKLNAPLLRDAIDNNGNSDGSASPDTNNSPTNQELDWRNYTPEDGNQKNGGNTVPDKTQILDSVQNQINRPVEKADVLKAGMIVMRKLSSEEISYLYNLGTKSKRTPEEMAQAKEILTSKLSAEDIETLYNMGLKYGKKMDFLKQ